MMFLSHFPVITTRHGRDGAEQAARHGRANAHLGCTYLPPLPAVSSPGDVELFPWARPASTLDRVRLTCKLANTTVDERILYAEQGTKQILASPWGRFSCPSTHRQIRQ